MTTFMNTGKLVLSTAIIVGAAFASPLLADEARLETFAAENGQTFFALTVPPIEATKPAPRDVVVLVDTSASQSGFYRDTAIAALEKCIAGLNPADRVQVVAVDLEARPMNDSLAGKGDSSVSSAVEKIRREPPLGSTDMELALTSAADMFDADSNRARTVVYIGDGMSPANLMQADAFGKLVTDLRKQNISVNSFAVGPQRDLELLASLANQTGGNLYVDEKMTWPNTAEGITTERALEENRRRGGVAGKALANWVHADVVVPTTTDWPAEFAAAYPKQLLPVRSDRETIVVGQLADEVETANLTAQAGNQELSWTVKKSPATSELSFLPQLVENAERTDGVALTTLGTRGLQETGRMLLASVDELTNLAERAAVMGDRENAGRIIQTVLRRDPGNPRAKTVQALIQKGAPVPAQQPSQPNTGASNDSDLNLVRIAQAGEVVPSPPSGGMIVGPQSGEFINGVPARDAVVDGSFLTEVERQNRIFSEMLEKEVELAVSQARDNMRSNPELASQNLKLVLENIRQSPQLIPEVRSQLIDRLQTVLQETARASVIDAELRQQAEERAAAARERRLINDRLTRQVEKEKQLVQRMNALMDEHRYAEAEEVAQILYEVDPDGVTPVVAELNARFDRHHYLQDITRERRHRAFWDTLFQVELSGIPQPDEPPIVYPDADVWEELTNRREKYKAVDLAGQDGAEQRITKALSDPLNSLGLEFQSAPLSEVVNFLRDEYNIEVQIDLQALDDLGLSPDEPIDVNLRNISLRSALRIMLRQLELTYVISDEVLLITTEEEALTRLQVKVYPVADLVLPIQTPSTGGGMMGGGMGGGMMGGGMGGGMMGGGMGGGMMGGGMGGGMMGGGGGAFSVADNQAPAAEATTESTEHVETQATEASSASTSKSEPASLTIDESVSPEMFWDGYFGAAVREPAAVRREVRDLMKKGRYDHVTALIQSALRHGQPQPWMYEALGIAMRMDNRDKADIERAIMSAADFSRSADELMYIAQYMSQLDMNERALQLYQQVVKVDSLRSEAYALGLRAAQRVDDLDGIRWACVGILQQAWPAEQEVISETAWQVAAATIEKMAKAGQKDEARAFRNELSKAIERDCVIRVSWTGDADVDLSVEEPSGSVCSPADPRAAGGGVNMGDVFTGVEKNSNTGVLSETYVCPRGFTGTYRAKITPVWGEVTAGKVTIDVFQHFNTDQVEQKTKVLELGKDGALVEVQLDKGRRTEPLEAQHIARAIERQEAVSRAVLAQQLDAVSDPRALPRRAIDPRDARLRRRLLGGGNGAVGFQPVVTALPEGTNFMATGVVSADRRYVRITSVPFFSTIGDVATFTFAGVANDDQGNDNNDNNDDNNNNNNNNNNN